MPMPEPMGFGVVAGLIVFFVLLLVVIVALVYVRGDVIRLWVPPVPYFRRGKHNKPLRIKIVGRGVAQTLNAELVKLIDGVIFESNTETAETTSAGTQEQVKDNEFKEDVPKDLGLAWTQIRENPEKFTIWGFYFRMMWRTFDGITGRWVYVYSLFSLEEMIKRLGRHRLVQGILLENPLSVHYPPSEEEWVMACRDRDRAKGVPINRKRMGQYKKEYRQLRKEKWLCVFLHPTVVATRQREVMERIEGFENLVAVAAHAMNVLGPQLAKYPTLKHYVLGREEFERQLLGQLHVTTDRLGKRTLEVAELQRAIKEVKPPIIVSPEGAPYPQFPPEPPPPREKPSVFRAQLPENWPVWLTFGSGFFMMVMGAMLFMVNPGNWGLLFFGGVMLVVALVLLLRERHGIGLSEAVKEKSRETKEIIEDR